MPLDRRSFLKSLGVTVGTLTIAPAAALAQLERVGGPGVFVEARSRPEDQYEAYVREYMTLMARRWAKATIGLLDPAAYIVDWPA